MKKCSDASCQLSCCQPVAGKDPVVTIACRKGYLVVFLSACYGIGWQIGAIGGVDDVCQSVPIYCYAVVGIGGSEEQRAGRLQLPVCLGEGCLMAIFLVVGDVIEVDACHSDIDTIEGKVVEVSGIVDIIHDEAFDIIVSSNTTVEEIKAERRRIDGTCQIDIIMIEDRLDVDIISEEGKTPSEKRSDTSADFGCYTKEKIGSVVDFIHFKAICQLYLCTPVIEVLDFDICGIAWRRENPI